MDKDQIRFLLHIMSENRVIPMDSHIFVATVANDTGNSGEHTECFYCKQHFYHL